MSKAVVCHSSVTALSGEAALFIDVHESNSPAVPSDLTASYRFLSGYSERFSTGGPLLPRLLLLLLPCAVAVEGM